MKTATRNEVTNSLKKSRAATIGVIVFVCFLGWLFAEPPPSDLEIMAEQSTRNFEAMQYSLASSQLDRLNEKAATVGLTVAEETEKQELISEMDELNKKSENRLRLD